MIKIVYCITRKDGMSREEFNRTWLEDHGPLVRKHADAIGAVRYIQSHTVMDEMNESMAKWRGMEPAYDGITEVWWKSREDMLAISKTPECLAANKILRDDEARFIDFAKSRSFMTEEKEIF